MSILLKKIIVAFIAMGIVTTTNAFKCVNENYQCFPTSTPLNDKNAHKECAPICEKNNTKYKGYLSDGKRVTNRDILKKRYNVSEDNFCACQ